MAYSSLRGSWLNGKDDSGQSDSRQFHDAACGLCPDRHSQAALHRAGRRHEEERAVARRAFGAGPDAGRAACRDSRRRGERQDGAASGEEEAEEKTEKERASSERKETMIETHPGKTRTRRKNPSTAPAAEASKRKVFGSQVVLDLYECETEHLDDMAWVKTTLINAARAAGATIVQ